MPPEPPPPQIERPDGAAAVPGAGFDFAFLHRVYRTTIVLTILGGVLIWEAFQAPSALGWLVGVALSLALLASVEWSVRRFVTPDAQSLRAVLAVSIAKIVLATVVLLVAFAAALRGWLALPWVLPGALLPGSVFLLKLAGRKLLSVLRQDS